MIAAWSPYDRRVRLDARKWLMARLHPSRYGDRLVHNGDREAPIAHVVGVIELDLKRLTAELDALETFTAAWLAAQGAQDRSVGDD